MVGIVLVSHSKALAEAVRDLALQAAPGARIEAAGGAAQKTSGETSGETYGTNADTIMDAILRAHSPDGVIVLMDMGSAVLSAQTAIMLLPPDVAEGVHMSGAPMVEGGIVAAVQACAGFEVRRILAEAANSLDAKRSSLGETHDAVPSTVEDAIETAAKDQRATTASDCAPCTHHQQNTMSSRTFVVGHEHGLHARPAAALVKIISQHHVRAYISAEGKKSVSAGSLVALLKLGVKHGDRVTVSAEASAADADLEHKNVLAFFEDMENFFTQAQ